MRVAALPFVALLACASTPPVPDGTACSLRIVQAGTTIDEAVDPTPPSGLLADLVVALRKRMTAPDHSGAPKPNPSKSNPLKPSTLASQPSPQSFSIA